MGLFSKNTLALTTLSIFMGGFFVFFGLLKVSPRISKEMTKELRNNYIAFAKVAPVLSWLGVKVNPKKYCLASGYTEIVTGLVLIFAPWRRIKLWVNCLMLALSGFELYSLWALNQKIDRMAPCMVAILMLTCRIIIHGQVTRRVDQFEKLKEKIAAAKEAKEGTLSGDKLEPSGVTRTQPTSGVTVGYGANIHREWRPITDEGGEEATYFTRRRKAPSGESKK